MIRRFELYKVRADTPPDVMARFRRMFRDVETYLPVVHHSFLGENTGGGEVTHVWEHTYDSWEEYEGVYLAHPFHICVLDRYLLPDNPECITERTARGGLAQYDMPSWDAARAAGLKRLVLLRLKADASQEWLRRVAERMEQVAEQSPAMRFSMVGRRPERARYPSKWGIVWEQAFADQRGLEAYLAQPSPLATLERSAWQVNRPPEVDDCTVVVYRKDA